MRIVLVHPAGSNFVPGKKDITPVANRMAPLGLLSIAAFLGQSGHDVSILDCLGPFVATDMESNIQTILDKQPDWVGFSTTTSSFPDAHEMARRIKEKKPRIRTVFGGVHVCAWGKQLFNDFDSIDCLCLGEGETPLLELAGGVAPETIPGMACRDTSINSPNPGKPIADLDTLPFPAYEKLEGFPKQYRLPLFSYKKTPGATMVTSRGCPYQCSYCDRSVFKRSYRYNSAEYVYEHLKYLKDRFGVRHVNIYDDLFTTHRQRIETLCRLLISRPLKMNFNCAVRVGHADDELLNLLKRAGCLQVSVGIESGDPDLLQVHKPGVYLNEVRNTIRSIQEKGLRAKGLFMMGLPGETEASIKKTGDFIMSLGLDDMNMSKFTPFYGAPVWKDITRFGSFDHDWRKMNCLNFVFVPHGIESRQKLDELYNRHVKRFYTDRKWRIRFAKRILEHRKSLAYMLKNLPAFLYAMRNFEPDRK